MIVKMTNDQMTDSPRTIWTMDHMPGGGHHVTANWHMVAASHLLSLDTLQTYGFLTSANCLGLTADSFKFHLYL